MFIGLMKYEWFLDLLGPHVTKFLIFHCFYHYFSNQTFIVHIDDLMKMLIFCWFYHHYRIVQHLNSMSFWLLSLAVPQWAFSEPQWAPRTPQGHEMIPQGTPGDLQWVPKDAPRLYSYEILCRCFRLPLDHIKTSLYLGSGAGIIDITKSLFGVLRWDNIPQTELALWGSHGLKGWWRWLTHRGLCFPSKMCFPLGTYRHRRK